MRILVVEDEKTIADFLRRGLTEAGYDLARRKGYDAVVLDVALPGTDGLATGRATASVSPSPGGWLREVGHRPPRGPTDLSRRASMLKFTEDVRNVKTAVSVTLK